MATRAKTGIKNHPTVSREEWIAARKVLLQKEKEFTRARDELSRQRRDLPWVRVDKKYVFDGPNGQETLAQLFENRSQLLVYHFMFPPDWSEGCKHCSFWADHFDATRVHLNHRDAMLVVVSRAPLSKIEPFRKRMGWGFKWLSSFETDFNRDYQVSFTPEEMKAKKAIYNFAVLEGGPPEREGISVFHKDGTGAVFHTYSAYARGIDMLNGTYQLLDLLPKGRDEEGLESSQEWVQYHDRYKD
jgi:predicted dithiol-disulfide oxidoreductase (DUF899 family)